MRVMSEVTNPFGEGHTNTKVQGKGEVIDIKPCWQAMRSSSAPR
jgi:hypothetical protein